jgi:hypothetical protein
VAVEEEKKSDLSMSDSDGCKEERSELVAKAFGKPSRKNERTIRDTLFLVCLWRKMYNGITDHKNGHVVRFTYIDAANKLGIKKKSLDDYLGQIKQGYKLNFDFKANGHKGIGVLRQFIKQRNAQRS